MFLFGVWGVGFWAIAVGYWALFLMDVNWNGCEMVIFDQRCFSRISKVTAKNIFAFSFIFNQV
tara:strand:+ start:244 stop:432 length:189 start_codon:yes stop_codon:yes gene_type:complete